MFGFDRFRCKITVSLSDIILPCKGIRRDRSDGLFFSVSFGYLSSDLSHCQCFLIYDYEDNYSCILNISECSSVTSLPALGGDLVCHLSSTCSSFDCCLHSNLLRRTLMSSVHLDTCTYKLLVSIEDLSYEFQMLNYQWGKLFIYNY